MMDRVTKLIDENFPKNPKAVQAAIDESYPVRVIVDCRTCHSLVDELEMDSEGRCADCQKALENMDT